MDIVTTSPSVIYKIKKTDGQEIEIDNPTNIPPAGEMSMEEPVTRAQIMVPSSL